MFKKSTDGEMYMIEKYKMNFSYMSNTRVDNLEQEKNVLLQVCMPWPLGSSIIQTQRIYSKPKKKKKSIATQ